MRINEERIYRMYLTEEEFALMHPITESVQYGYFYFKDKDKDGEFVLTIKGEEMLDEIKEKLEHEQYVQEYEEYNSYMVEQIRDLLNSIYYELNY